MKSFTLVVFIFSSLKSVYGVCPNPENIYPCFCTPGLKSTLNCVGNEITDLKSILKGKFNSPTEVEYKELRIIGTSITLIEAETFDQLTFEGIIIGQNSKLTKIDPKTFIKSAQAKSVNQLHLYDLPLFDDSHELFSFANSLQVKELIRLNKLNIHEIPDNAFHMNPHLFHIIMTDNSIRRIGKSAFIGLTNLQILQLNSNQISVIDSNGLSFDLTNAGKTVHVILADNQLTKESFRENWTNSKEGRRKIIFEFPGNKITSLPKLYFESNFLSHSLEYMLFGVQIHCDCNIKYLFSIKSQIISKLRDTYCTNLFDGKAGPYHILDNGVEVILNDQC